MILPLFAFLFAPADDLQASLERVARAATAMIDGDVCKRIETSRSRSFALKKDPRDPWAASDNYDVNDAAFTAVKKTTMRVAKLCDVECDVNVWMPLESDPSRIQVVVRNVHEMSAFWPWGALNQELPAEMKSVLGAQRAVFVLKKGGYRAVLTPIFDSLGDVVGVAEVAARVPPDPRENVVRTWEGTIEIPTYVHSARETEPPLFANSTVTGLYPFTTYVMPFTADSPKPKTYRAIFVENEYLKLTYIPEFGGRIFSLYDKLRGREVFYRNDVIKPASYNPRNSWPQSGLELTGPHDLHMLTLYGEPFWANRVVERPDGSISLVLGETDPVYHMNVSLTATLHPGIAALEIGVSCFNGRDARMPQMLWINTAINATPKTRFIYQMSRTVGHTTADVADWPVHNGIDYSWDRNNKHMLGVFGIDEYGDFNGAYQFDRDYGLFRVADRRVVQGMKLWTFGYGEGAKGHERGYTDNAGPYVELQSGRHVWDGHYEWVEPHTTESWSEWWVPVAGTGGVVEMTRDLALNVDGSQYTLAATRAIRGLRVITGASDRTVDLDPRTPFRFTVGEPAASTRVMDSSGRTVLEYTPGVDHRRKEYTPFTKPLEHQHKPVEQMSAEELAIAAEYKFKELDEAGARALLEKALATDAGYSRAQVLLGIDDFRAGRYEAAASQLKKAIERDQYSDDAYFYLAMAQFALGQKEAERTLYYIWPGSAHYGPREFYLGRLDVKRNELDSAIGHLRASGDLAARHLLAVAFRVKGDRAAALREIDALEDADPVSRTAAAERWLLTDDAGAQAELLRRLGGQSQEAIDLAVPYRKIERWDDAARLLRLVRDHNSDPYGTPPEFYYTLAFLERRVGRGIDAQAPLIDARAATKNIDRFPYREESEAPLAEAVGLASDTVARYALGCLLYYRHRPAEAIAQWEAALKAGGDTFAIRRALGLAYAEQGQPVDQSAAQLERAVELNPDHVRTRNDLSQMYARAGRFDQQLAVVEKALARSQGDDDLTEAVFTANLLNGRYAEAERLIGTHRFAPRHRSYGLRDKYRLMRFGMGARLFGEGDFAGALKMFDSALAPPESLGADDFESQPLPIQQYFRGRALERLGKAAEARKAYERAVEGVALLSGDRDSWSPENFYMVLALDRLGRKGEPAAIEKRFEDFANGELNARNAQHRAVAAYVLALVRRHQGRDAESAELLKRALEAAPDYLPARLLSRGDLVW